MGTITFFGSTDVGKVRSNNEDAFVIRHIWDDKHILAVVADGVGGYEGGEIASALARESIVEYLESYSNGERVDLLKQAVVSANNRIHSERNNLPQYSRMSCVLTAVLVETESGRINMAHVGDTRLYQYANGGLVKLSHDHSLVGYREEIGELTEVEAMTHPQRNVIGRDVGSQFLESNGGDYVETGVFPWLPNSALLLCSDGLCDMITSEQMKMEIGKDIPVNDKVNNLIKDANDAGGRDNVTVVLIESRDEEEVLQTPVQECNAADESHIPAASEKTTAGGNDKRTSSCRVSLIVLGAIAVLIAGYVLGGFTGNRVLPGVFSVDVIKDTVRIDCPDSLGIDPKRDTSDLDSIQLNSIETERRDD